MDYVIKLLKVNIVVFEKFIDGADSNDVSLKDVIIGNKRLSQLKKAVEILSTEGKALTKT